MSEQYYSQTFIKEHPDRVVLMPRLRHISEISHLKLLYQAKRRLDQIEQDVYDNISLRDKDLQ